MMRHTFRGEREAQTSDEDVTSYVQLPPPGRRTLTSTLSTPYVQRKGEGVVGPDAARALDRAAGGGGFALPADVRARFEGSLGVDLCGVRVHTGDASAQAAKKVGARAYTTGQDIHFASGHYDPSSAAGLELLAHEVAHTVQQSGGAAAGRQDRLEVSMPGDSLEVDADRAAEAMVAGQRATVAGGAGAAIARDPLDGGVAPVAGVPRPPPPPPPPGAGPDAGPAVAGTPAPDATAAPDTQPAPVPTARPPAGPPPGPTGPVAPAGPTGGPPGVGGTEPPQTAPQPTARPPAGAVGGNAAAGPGSETPWADFFKGNGGNVVRSVLEVSRLVPGWGLLGGLGADVIEGYQNYHGLDGVSGEAADNFRAMMVARQVVVVGVNGLNHVRYVNELLTDGLIVSVVGAELAPLSAGCAEVLAGISIGAQSVLTGVDLGIAVAAGMQASQYGEGTPEYVKYHELKRNFIVNVGGDAVGLILDIVDLSSGGLANAAAVKEANLALKGTKVVVAVVKDNLVPLINAWVGVWGDAVWNWIDPVEAAPAPAAAAPVQRDADPAAVGGSAAGPGGGRVQVGPNGVLRSVAGQVMMNEINEIEQMYQFGCGAVDYALGLPQQMADDVSRVITEITGEQEPFIWLRDKIAEGIEEGTAQLARLLEMKNTAAQAQQVASVAGGHLDRAIAAIDGLQLPRMPAPTPTDLGDNAVADAAEWLVDGAAGLTADAINAVRDRLQAAIDAVKNTCKQQVVDMKSELQWVVDFLAEFQVQANAQTSQIAALGAEMSSRLGQCQNIEDIFNMLIGAGAELMGSEGFTVDDLRQMWADIRGMIDQGFVAARKVASDVGGGGDAAAAPPVSRDADGNGVSPDASEAVQRAQGSDGAPLPDGLRDRFETGLGTDLSGVRVHTGGASADAARAVGARAYATGQDIHFADGKYDPGSQAGQHLIAHEVAHTVQHAGGRVAQHHNKLEVSSPGDALELDAERTADALTRG